MEQSVYTQPGIKREHLFLNWQVSRKGKLEFLPSYHLNTPAPLSCLTTESNITCELIDAHGQLLEARKCHASAFGDKLNDTNRTSCEVLPWFSDTAKITLRQGEQASTIDVEKQAPSVSMDTPTPEEGPGN